jgi:sortase (surface protein transpeptidase)
MSRLSPALATLALALGVIVMAQSMPRTAPLALPPAVVATATAEALAVPTAPTIAPTSASPSPTALPAIPDGYRVRIARLGIDLAIREGDVERDSVQQKTPEGFAFHLPGTGLPASGLNVYLYAHARVGMFLSLWNARVGDEVIITTPAGHELRYVVSEIHPRVPPNEVSWAQPDGPERLTLQTSTGPNPGDPRFVVIAQPA